MKMDFFKKSAKKLKTFGLVPAVCAAVLLTACHGGTGQNGQDAASFVDGPSSSASHAVSSEKSGGAASKTGGSVSSEKSAGNTSSTVAQNASNGRKKSPGRQSKPNNVVNLRVWDGADNLAMTQAIMDYQRIHPNVTISREGKPNPSADEVRSAVSGNVAPDIIYIDQVYNASLGREGYFADLCRFGASGVKNKFLSSAIKSLSAGDELYGLPFDANTICFYYNKDILSSAGATPPKDLAGIKAAGRAINKKFSGKVEAYTLPFLNYQNTNWSAFNFLFYLWRMGGDVLTPDLKHAAFNSPAGVEALETIAGFYKEGIVSNEYNEQAFINGNVGMIDNGCWQMSALFGKVSRANFGVLPMPRLKKNVAGYSGLGLSSYGVTASSKNKQAAYDFLEFYCTNKRYQLDYCTTKNLIPSLKSALSNKFYSSAQWKVVIKQLEHAKFRPGVKDWAYIEKALESALYNALVTGRSPAAALNAAADAVDKMLSK